VPLFTKSAIRKCHLYLAETASSGAEGMAMPLPACPPFSGRPVRHDLSFGRFTRLFLAGLPIMLHLLAGLPVLLHLLAGLPATFRRDLFKMVDSFGRF